MIIDRMKRTEAFRYDRFGLFIHWGAYSIPAKGEWLRSHERLTMEEYRKYVDAFHPSAFAPASWVKLAKKAGMRYAVLTAKHHEGFCLFDTATTAYKADRDYVREFLDAFRAEGLKVGLYYSLIDWSHPDYPHYGDKYHPMRDCKEYDGKKHNFENYKAYMHSQIKELLTGYGKLDILWFDFSYDNMTGKMWGAEEILAMIRRYQPEMIFNNRLEGSGSATGSIIKAQPTPYAGDFTSPEQMIPPGGIVNEIGEPIPWESCITLNGNWGYAKDDHNFKSAKMIVRTLVECVSKNGNLILNIGPDGEGRIPEESVRILEEVGEWMKVNGESIYGCHAAMPAKPEWGRYTQRGNTLYAHVYEDITGPVCLPGLGGKVGKIKVLKTGTESDPSDFWSVARYSKDHAFFFTDQMKKCSYPLPDSIDTVVRIELK